MKVWRISAPDNFLGLILSPMLEVGELYQ